MDIDIEEIDIDLLNLKDLNESIESIDNGDLLQIKNIIYSDPFLYDNNLEHGFKVHIIDDYIYLYEIIFDDNKITMDESIVKETLITKIYKNEALKLIKQNIDIRDKNTILNHEIVNLENNLSSDKLNENKKAVLKELYNIVIESYN